MKTYLSLWLCLCMGIHIVHAQVINGKIYLGLSETEGLAAVRVEGLGASTETSDELGRFALAFPGKERGALVELDLYKPGYVVINRENTRPRIPNNDQERLRIYMCPAAKRNALAIQYYKLQVNRNIEQNYQAEAKALAEGMNYEAIALLTQKKQTAERMADSLAARLSRFDPKTASDELTRAIQLFQEGDVHGALEMLDADKILARIEARNQAIVELSAANDQDLETLKKAAEMSISELQFDKALKYYEAIAMAYPKQPDAIWEICYFLFEHEKNELLVKYAKIMRDASPEKRFQAAAYSFLGLGLQALFEMDKAIEAHSEALRLYRELAEHAPWSYQTQVALALSNLSNVYKSLGNYEQSIKASKEAILLYRDARERDTNNYIKNLNTDLALAVYNLGNTYRQLDSTDQALSLIEEALYLYQSDTLLTHSMLKIEQAICLATLGTVLGGKKKYREASQRIKESIAMSESVARIYPTRYHFCKGYALHQMGNIYFMLGALDSAAIVYQQSLDIRYKLVDEDPVQYANDAYYTLENLANTYYQQKDYPTAIQTYESAFRLNQGQNEKVLDLRREGTASMLYKIGMAYKKLGQFKEALLSFDEAIQETKILFTQDSGQYDIKLVGMFLAKANLMLDMNQYKEAISNYQICLALAENFSSHKKEAYQPDIAIILHSKGVCHYYIQEDSTAILNYEAALSIREKHIELNPSDTAVSTAIATNLSNLGVVYKRQNRFQDAEHAYLQALKIRNRLPNAPTQKSNFSKARLQINLGNFYRDRHELKKASNAYEDAKLIYEQYKADSTAVSEVILMEENIAYLGLPLTRAEAYYHRGDLAYRAEKQDTAWTYWKQAIALYDQIPAEEMSLNQRYTASFAYEDYVLLTEDKHDKYQQQRKVITLRESVWQAVPDNAEVQHYLASAYYNLSWYALFEQSYQESEIAAQRSLELDPNATGVITNLVSALVLQGKTQEAQQWVIDWKDKPWGDDRYQTFAEVFIADWQELASAGITHPDLDKLRKLLN